LESGSKTGQNVPPKKEQMNFMFEELFGGLDHSYWILKNCQLFSFIITDRMSLHSLFPVQNGPVFFLTYFVDRSRERRKRTHSESSEEDRHRSVILNQRRQFINVVNAPKVERCGQFSILFSSIIFYF
jgi:hypothetical protein